MGALDEIENKAKSEMDDPAQRQKIEQIAKDKGISMEEAKDHFMRNKNSDQNQ